MSWLFALFLFSAAQVATPGPANMLMLATGARFGLRRALPFVAGVAFGKQFIIWPLGFGLLSVQGSYPIVFEALKWASVAYILWLAYRVAGMRMTVGSAEGNPPKFIAGLIVHPLNPKAWGVVTACFTNFIPAGTNTLQATLSVAICLLFWQAVLHPCWTYGGHWVAQRLAGRPGERYLMWTLAALTVLSVLYALFGATLMGGE